MSQFKTMLAGSLLGLFSRRTLMLLPALLAMATIYSLIGSRLLLVDLPGDLDGHLRGLLFNQEVPQRVFGLPGGMEAPQQPQLFADPAHQRLFAAEVALWLPVLLGVLCGAALLQVAKHQSLRLLPRLRANMRRDLLLASCSISLVAAFLAQQLDGSTRLGAYFLLGVLGFYLGSSLAGKLVRPLSMAMFLAAELLARSLADLPAAMPLLFGVALLAQWFLLRLPESRLGPAAGDGPRTNPLSLGAGQIEPYSLASPGQASAFQLQGSGAWLSAARIELQLPVDRQRWTNLVLYTALGLVIAVSVGPLAQVLGNSGPMQGETSGLLLRALAKEVISGDLNATRAPFGPAGTILTAMIVLLPLGALARLLSPLRARWLHPLDRQQRADLAWALTWSTAGTLLGLLLAVALSLHLLLASLLSQPEPAGLPPYFFGALVSAACMPWWQRLYVRLIGIRRPTLMAQPGQQDLLRLMLLAIAGLFAIRGLFTLWLRTTQPLPIACWILALAAIAAAGWLSQRAWLGRYMEQAEL